MTLPAVTAAVVGPIRGQSLRDGIGVDELVYSEGVLEQIRSARALAGTVGTGEHDGQWCPRGHVRRLCTATLRLTSVQFRAPDPPVVLRDLTALPLSLVEWQAA